MLQPTLEIRSQLCIYLQSPVDNGINFFLCRYEKQKAGRFHRNRPPGVMLDKASRCFSIQFYATGNCTAVWRHLFLFHSSDEKPAFNLTSVGIRGLDVSVAGKRTTILMQRSYFGRTSCKPRGWPQASVIRTVPACTGAMNSFVPLVLCPPVMPQVSFVASVALRGRGKHLKVVILSLFVKMKPCQYLLKAAKTTFNTLKCSNVFLLSVSQTKFGSILFTNLHPRSSWYDISTLSLRVDYFVVWNLWSASLTLWSRRPRFRVWHRFLFLNVYFSAKIRSRNTLKLPNESVEFPLPPLSSRELVRDSQRKIGARTCRLTRHLKYSSHETFHRDLSLRLSVDSFRHLFTCI